MKFAHAFSLCVAAFSLVALADSQATDAAQWLHRIQQAAQKLNYSGTFVYLQQGGQPQTSRITHVIEGAIERERLEMLDGAPIVIVRTNDEVRSYAGDTKTVSIENRRAKAAFPALLSSDQVASILTQYNARKWDTQRVAGQECQVLLLEPRDGMRYAHKLWADAASGLLLKAQAFNEKGDVVEQIAFTQVEIGGPPERYHARIQKKEGGRDWRTSSTVVTETSLSLAGWKMGNPPPGFRKVMEVRRGMGETEVGQVVFSDGLASISVFVEPLRARMPVQEGLSNQGAVNIFRRKLGEHLVTVLGEAPPACVTQVGKAIEFRPVQK